jgi:MtN3 and saliva related transmembrane protein
MNLTHSAEIVGTLAGTLTTISFLPQAIKVMRERQTAAISLQMYVIFTAGVACWLVYGLLIGSFSVTVANAITLLLAASVLVMKLRYG